MRLLSRLCLRAASALFDLAGRLDHHPEEHPPCLVPRLTAKQHAEYWRALCENDVLVPGGLRWPRPRTQA